MHDRKLYRHRYEGETELETFHHHQTDLQFFSRPTAIFLSLTLFVFWGSGSRHNHQKHLNHLTILLQKPDQLPNLIFPVLRKINPFRGHVGHHLFFTLQSSFCGRNVTSLRKVYYNRKWKMFK